MNLTTVNAGNTKTWMSQAWELLSAIPVGRLRQENLHEFKVSLFIVGISPLMLWYESLNQSIINQPTNKYTTKETHN